MKDFKINKDGSVTFKNIQVLNKYISKRVKETSDILRADMLKSVFKEVETETEIITRDTLHRLWKFGNKRASMFIDEYNNQIECITKGYVTLEDLDNLNNKKVDI